MTNQKLNQELSTTITLSLEIETNFKMFTYRIISPEDFVSRAETLLEIFKKELTEAEKLPTEPKNIDTTDNAPQTPTE